jgi:hypothetical protein
MRKALIIFTTAVSILAFTFNLQAEEKHGRIYAGAGVGYAIERFDDGDLKDFPGNSSIDNTWGVNVFAGYWWFKHLAVEGNFNWYADFDGEAADDRDFDISIWTVMLDAKIFSPSLWQDRVFPYVRIGGGYMDVDIDARRVDSNESDWAYNMGLGIDAFITHQLSIGVDGKHVWGTGDTSDFNHWMLSLRAAYHF